MIPPIVDQIRATARAYGWAIGVHGSLARDIDLIAVPWTSTAASADALVDRICEAHGYFAHGRTPRPLGRICRLLTARDAENDRSRINRGEIAGPPHPKGLWFPPAIDLSIVDPRSAKGEA